MWKRGEEREGGVGRRGECGVSVTNRLNQRWLTGGPRFYLLRPPPKSQVYFQTSYLHNCNGIEFSF
jgi:hypothetical protein